jgi:hypothetical protein
MALLPVQSGAVTLLDYANLLDPNGKIAAFANLLSQKNEMFLDARFTEGNLPTGHEAVVETALPVTTFRKMYQGTPPSKGQRAKITDTCGMLESRSEIDREIARLNGNTREFRASVGSRYIESVAQRASQALLYGDATRDSEEFNGLAQRYSTINTSNSELANNVISAGGSGNVTSMWLLQWGDELTMIYPKGSKAGLDVEDLGEFDAFDANQNRYRAIGDLYQMKLGLHVADWRRVVRICNISIADLLSGSGTQAATAATYLPKLMVRAQMLLPGAEPAVFYANRLTKGMLATNVMNVSQNALSVQDCFEQFGKLGPGFPMKQLDFLGSPVRTMDRILSTESVLT